MDFASARNPSKTRDMRVLCVVVVAACGGGSAEGPVTVALHTPRDAVVRQLETKHRYCATPGQRPAATEVYPRCDRPGAEWGESWITATYEADQLVELRRYERFSDDGRAVERWNQLVGARAGLTEETLRDRPLEPGTRSMKAYRIAADTIVAIYLLTPTPPEDASVLEAILQAR